MQVTGIGESQTKSSLVRTAAQIYKKNGLLGFTAGFGATLTREIPAFMCYFGSYDMFLKIQNYSPCKFPRSNFDLLFSLTDSLFS